MDSSRNLSQQLNENVEVCIILCQLSAILIKQQQRMYFLLRYVKPTRIQEVALQILAFLEKQSCMSNTHFHCGILESSLKSKYNSLVQQIVSLQLIKTDLVEEYGFLFAPVCSNQL